MPYSGFQTLPQRPKETPFWNRERGFEWDHNLPTDSHGGIRYIPALDLMMVMNSVGSVDFCDPLSMRIVKRLVYAANTNGVLDVAYVPSCHKIVVPVHDNGSGLQIRITDLKTGKTTVIAGLNAGLYSTAYCPPVDKVYVTSYTGTPVVYVVDPWTEALHTTPTVSGTFGGVTFGICFCPLNGKLYAASRTANNIYRIDPVTNAIDNTIAAGGAYDGLFYADAMQKVMVGGTQGLAWKTLDPLNADTLAALGYGSTCNGGCSSPLGRTLLQNGNTMNLIDQAGAQKCHMTEPSVAPLYYGWNPVTEKFWASDAFASLFVVDPLEMSTSRVRYGQYLRQRII